MIAEINSKMSYNYGENPAGEEFVGSCRLLFKKFNSNNDEKQYIPESIDRSGNENYIVGEESLHKITVSLPFPEVDYQCKISNEDEKEHSNIPRFGLSLCGGGSDVIYNISYLSLIEENIKDLFGKKELTSVFDCIGGSSFGGIIPLVSTHPKLNLNDLKDIVHDDALFPPFEHKRKKEIIDYQSREKKSYYPNKEFTYIYEPHFVSNNLNNQVCMLLNSIITIGPRSFAYRYPSILLENLFKQKFDDFALDSAKTDFLIPACSVYGKHYIFTRENNMKLKFWELAMITTALPTYYNPINISKDGLNDILVNGSTWASNPADLVHNYIAKKYNSDINKTFVLSLNSTGFYFNENIYGSNHISSSQKYLDMLIINNNNNKREQLKKLTKNYEEFVIGHPRRFDEKITHDSNVNKEWNNKSLTKQIKLWEDQIRKKLEN